MKIWEFIQKLLAFLLAIPALIVVIPLGLLIKTHSSGPILFRTMREGKQGKCFLMYKMRTMVDNAEDILGKTLDNNESMKEEWQHYGRIASDPRIAGPFARFARRSSIDELPQFLNVVLGEMNLIGPRPLPAQIASQLAIKNRTERQTLLPGMTGLWQVSGRSELTIQDMGCLDSIYVKKRSVQLDLKIFLFTIVVIISKRGAY